MAQKQCKRTFQECKWVDNKLRLNPEKLCPRALLAKAKLKAGSTLSREDKLLENRSLITRQKKEQSFLLKLHPRRL